jgi:crotonobetainyl-CoA:carnitine CoA-transferase CaiB-like acyl-CoA transferase
VEILRADDIACGPVYNLDTAPDDPQIRHNDMILELAHSLGGQVKLIGNPIKTSSIDNSEYTAPPTLGQHSREVLGEILGYSQEKIDRLLTAQQKRFEEKQKNNPRKGGF